MRAARRLSLKLPASLFLFLLVLLPRAMQAQDFDAGARALEEKIAARAGPRGTVSLEVRNLSSLSVAQAGAVKQTLEAGLREHGATLVAAPPADSEVRVTLAENVQGYVWVAEVRRGPATQVAMVVVARSASEAAASGAAAIVLHKQLVLVQAAQVLDFLLPPLAPDGMPRMLVLEPERVAFYRFAHSNWELQESQPIPHRQPWPRDLRGRLGLNEDVLNVGMPGVSCSGLAHREFVMQCEESSEGDSRKEWPLDAGGEERASASFPAGRNYFTRELSVYGDDADWQLPPFFSAALLKIQEGTHAILTAVDGPALLYEDGGKPVAKFPGWGSEIVSVGTGCGAAWQVLVTRSGDWTEPDAIQAYEILDHQAAAVGQPLELAGPVTALWPTVDGKSAHAVVRNLKTGKYEAYNITINCGR
ncbi:MAG TPA: hypothetical protein VG033_06560 [Candidatus Acidoferrales bacterium]|jgi:hypothetical protein|nr:hypothetical protein [Candidatus Acidoferrales bacterium]